MPDHLAAYFAGSSRDAAVHPLTHHEILSLIAPFTRRGRQADLEASNRSERRLCFKPVEHDAFSATIGAAQEVLTLENPRGKQFRLIRTLTLGSGLSATLQADGDDPEALLSRIESIAPQRQFRTIEGVAVAFSYQLTGSETPPTLELTRGAATVAGIQVVIKADTVKGYPVAIELTPDSTGPVELPDDLLAVIGWGWSPLRKSRGGWNGTLKARGREPQRSHQLELKMEKAVGHMARTLAQPPSQFHETLRRARWAVTFRRAIPLLFFIGLMALAGGLTMIEMPQDSIWNLLLMGAPPLLLFAAFSMRDTPPLEIPPLPRRFKTDAWQLGSPAAPAMAAVPVATGRDPTSPASTPVSERDA
jgi:hypothetical protein